MTADYVAFHATERPEAVAFIDNGREITYGQFSRDIRKFMRALRDLGLNRGRSAGLACDDIYIDLVLLLALERLGVTTVMLDRHEAPKAAPALEGLDLVLSGWEIPFAAEMRRHAITPDWVRDVQALPDPGDGDLPPQAPDDIILILRTTGTTGNQKILRSPRRTQEAWADEWIWQLGFTKDSRYIITLPFNVHTIYTLVVGVVRAGGTIVLETRMHIAEAMSVHGITHAALFPIHLRTILDSLPPGVAKPANLTMVSFGATLSEALRERATARLATTLYDNYGSREAGFVARIWVPDSGGIGIVSPRAQVDVVDEQGRSLPPGQLGLLRIKTPFMHTEYIDNPEASREFFKDGWSQPGDLAILHGPRRIQLMGRVGDLLLIGGAKVPPNILEELALRIVNAKDAGVCAIANQDGIEEIWIALAGAESDAAALKARLEPSLRPLLQFAVFHVATLAQIPRNAGGKVQRDQLKRAVAEIAVARPPR